MIKISGFPPVWDDITVNSNITIGNPGLMLPTRYANCVGYGIADLESWNDGDLATSWTNRVNSTLSPATTGATRPTFNRNSIIGGRACFTFGGAHQLVFPAGALGWFNNVAGGTLLMVGTIAPTAANHIAMMIGTSGAGVGRAAIRGSTGNFYSSQGRRLDADVSVFTSSNPTALSATTPVILLGDFNYSGGNHSIYVNETTVTPVTFAASGNTSATNSADLTLGGVTTQFLTGKIAAWAIWNARYTPSTILDLYRNWRAYYKI